MYMMTIENPDHHIVATESIQCPFPQFNLPSGQTYSFVEYQRTAECDLIDRIRDATILLTATVPVSAAALSPSVTPRLRFIVVLGSGTDSVDKRAAWARGIPVCNCPGVNVDSVSEHAIGLYFSARRKIVQLSNATTVPLKSTLEYEWKRNDGALARRLRTADGKAPLTCRDEIVGIVGFGLVGKRVAEMARGLGMKVIVAERKGVTTPRPDRALFEDVLRTSTVLILCLPLDSSTLNLISTTELRMMQPPALLINVARGGIVSEQALLGALQEGTISGAATDVLVQEPAGKGDSPLLSAEAEGLNLTITPHVAWYSEKTLRNLQDAVKFLVESWCHGKVVNEVDY